MRLCESGLTNSYKSTHAITLSQSALLELTQVRNADSGQMTRTMLGFMLQALVDAEATSVIGAEPHQRREERTTQRRPPPHAVATKGQGVTRSYSRPIGTPRIADAGGGTGQRGRGTRLVATC